MLNVILYQPEIPPNTGNIMRLCANTGAHLHLIGPLGFQMDAARLRRAGLDYRDLAAVSQYRSWEDFRTTLPEMPLWPFSTRGSRNYSEVEFTVEDGLLFGPETRGLPDAIINAAGVERCLRLPMVRTSRSLNLSNSVAVGLFEAWRQLAFTGASSPSA